MYLLLEPKGFIKRRQTGRSQERHSYTLLLVLALAVCGFFRIVVSTSDLDSSTDEDSQYYDDDLTAAGRFVTDEDVEDQLESHLHQRHLPTNRKIDHNRRHLRHHHDHCPPAPSSAADLRHSLCYASRCSSDADCSSGPQMACCHNGCVYSCMRKVDPPLVFDWLEETDLKQPKRFNDSEQDPPIEGTSARTRTWLAAESTAETIALAGGCFLNREQYDHLRVFRLEQHFKSCGCERGDIVCALVEVKDMEHNPER